MPLRPTRASFSLFVSSHPSYELSILSLPLSFQRMSFPLFRHAMFPPSLPLLATLSLSLSFCRRAKERELRRRKPSTGLQNRWSPLLTRSFPFCSTRRYTASHPLFSCRVSSKREQRWRKTKQLGEGARNNFLSRFLFRPFIATNFISLPRLPISALLSLLLRDTNRGNATLSVDFLR